MAKVCDLTGKRPVVGNHVSHANNKTKRKFNPNLQRKKIYLESENQYVDLKISTSALRTINKLGLDGYIKKLAAKGKIK